MKIFKGLNGDDVFGAADDDETFGDLKRLIDEPSPLELHQSDDHLIWAEPENLGQGLPPVPAFNVELLPTSLRPMVEDVADRMQVPADFPAVAAVATLAGLCGRRATIQPKEHDTSWKVTPNLWGGIIASPGLKKSPVIAAITAPARAIEKELRMAGEVASREYEEAVERAKLEKEAWATQFKQAIKKGQEPPTRPEIKMPAPTQRRLLVSDATPECLQRIMSENPAGVMVIRDELAGFLAGLERQGREMERAFYLEAWNGDSHFTMDRIARGTIHAEHCCVSLFGGIQPGRLNGYLADALRDGPSNDGLMQRFQLLVWPDVPSACAYRDRVPDLRAQSTAEEVYRRVAAMDEANPLLLKFDPDAQALFVDWLSKLEQYVRSEDLSPHMQAHLAKYRSLMPSLALLFSLADGELEHVSLRHAQQAADWCEYLEEHARRVYESRISPERLAAISLSKKLSGGWKADEGTFTVRDVYTNDWSGLNSAEQVRAALTVLEDAGWVVRKKVESKIGRPSEVYAINPHIWKRT